MDLKWLAAGLAFFVISFAWIEFLARLRREDK